MVNAVLISDANLLNWVRYYNHMMIKQPNNNIRFWSHLLASCHVNRMSLFRYGINSQWLLKRIPKCFLSLWVVIPSGYSYLLDHKTLSDWMINWHVLCERLTVCFSPSLQSQFGVYKSRRIEDTGFSNLVPKMII